MWCWGGSLLAESVCELAAQSLVVLGEFSVARVGGLQLAQQRGVCGALPCGHRCLRCLAAEIAEALDLGPDAGLDVKPGSRHVRPAGDSFQRHQGAGGVQLARPSLRLSAARVTVRVAVRSSRPSAPSRARRQWRLRPSLGRSVSPPRPWSAPRSAWPADGRHAVIPRAGCGGRSPRPHGPRPARPKRCGNSWAGCCAATPRPGVAGCCAATPRPGGRPPDWPSKWSPPPDRVRVGLWLPPAYAPNGLVAAAMPGARIIPAYAPAWPTTGVSAVELTPRRGVWAPVLDPTVPALPAHTARTPDGGGEREPGHAAAGPERVGHAVVALQCTEQLLVHARRTPGRPRWPTWRRARRGKRKPAVEREVAGGDPCHAVRPLPHVPLVGAGTGGQLAAGRGSVPGEGAEPSRSPSAASVMVAAAAVSVRTRG